MICIAMARTHTDTQRSNRERTGHSGWPPGLVKTCFYRRRSFRHTDRRTLLFFETGYRVAFPKRNQTDIGDIHGDVVFNIGTCPRERVVDHLHFIPQLHHICRCRSCTYNILGSCLDCCKAPCHYCTFAARLSSVVGGDSLFSATRSPGRDEAEHRRHTFSPPPIPSHLDCMRNLCSCDRLFPHYHYCFLATSFHSQYIPSMFTL